MTSKIPLKRLDSSDCVIYVGRKESGEAVAVEGTPYRVHEGEWVDIMPVVSVGQYMDYLTLLQSQTGEETNAQAAFDGLVKTLTQRVMAWNWTDLYGEPLAQPHNNPDVFGQLTTYEIRWLLTSLTGETDAERKNGGEPSPTT